MSRDADCNITLLIILIILGKWGQQYQHNVGNRYCIYHHDIVLYVLLQIIAALKKKHYATAGGSF